MYAPPPPPISGHKAFVRGGGVPPPFIHTPPLEGYLQGWGGGRAQNLALHFVYGYLLVRWGSLCEGVGARNSARPSKAGNQTFWWDALGFRLGYPGGSRNVQEERFVFNFRTLEIG